ncbi:MAG: hypothetical protein RIQ60_1919 [Pseudomonadota bacterium]|jgi:hypothetical protein
MSPHDFPTLVMVNTQAGRRTCALRDDGPADAGLIEQRIAPTAENAAAWLAGEAQAGAYLSRMAAGMVQPGELAARLCLHDVPEVAGFLARVEKCLNAHLREVQP